MISPYARKEVTWILVIGALVTIGVVYGFGWWGLLPALAALALASFYRHPQRRVPHGEGLLLAPADGKVVSIRRGVESDTGPQLRMMIFLSVFNVHMNRAPCAGEVEQLDYRKGEFLNALNPAADERNEANLLVLRPRPGVPGPVGVRQIAGILAKRIVCAARPGDVLAAGQTYGMIKLGSRTEVILPEDEGWQLQIGVGDRVKAGLTILARYEKGGRDA